MAAYRRVYAFGHLLADCSGILCSFRVWDYTFTILLTTSLKTQHAHNVYMQVDCWQTAGVYVYSVRLR